MDAMERFVESLRPLLRERGAKAAYVVGSWARGEADAWNDVDGVIVAPSERPFVELAKRHAGSAGEESPSGST